jgi:hypothetical protein
MIVARAAVAAAARSIELKLIAHLLVLVRLAALKKQEGTPRLAAPNAWLALTMHRLCLRGKK